MKKNEITTTTTTTNNQESLVVVADKNGNGQLTKSTTTTKKESQEGKTMNKTQKTATTTITVTTKESEIEKAKKNKVPYFTEPAKATDGRGKITVWKPVLNKENEVVSAELKPISMAVPKNVKRGLEKVFLLNVQGLLLQYQAVELKTSIAKLMGINSPENKKRRELTDSEKSRLDGLKKQLDLNKKSREVFDVVNPKDDAFCHICSRFLLNAPVKAECSGLIEKLSDLSERLDEGLSKMISDGTAVFPAEVQEKVTACKDAIRSALAPCLAETEFCNEFKLSISNKDIINFYKLGFDGWNSNLSEIQLYTPEKSKKFEVQIVRYFLHKVAVADTDKFVQ